MPTVAQLDRLKALADRLTPLADIQRGDLIKAQNWNDVVGSLIEVARVVLTDGTSTEVPPHEHPDQVKLSWLDPTLRSLVQRGPLADPAAEGRILELQRNLTRLSTSIDHVSNDTKEVRDRVAVVSTNDLARQSEVATVRRTVDGINDGRDDVLALRTTLQSVQQDVQTALTVGQKLTLNGQPVDMAVIDQRIKAVEDLRSRLQTPAGDLLDATKLENRLTELTNTVVTQQQLQDALKAQPGKIPQDTLDALQASLHAALKTDMDSAISSLGDNLRTDVTARFAQVDSLVARAVSDALPGATQSALSTIRPEIAAAASQALEDARADAAGKLADATAALRADLSTQLDAVRQSTTSFVQSEVSKQLDASLTPVKQNVLDLQQSMSAVTAKQSQQDAAMQTLSTRVETVARDDASARSDLKAALQAQIDSSIKQAAATLDAHLADVAAQQQQRIDASIVQLRGSLVDQLTKVVADTVTTQVKQAETRINANMVGIARDQVSAVQDQLQASVNSAVSNSMQAVPGLVSQEVRRQTANLPDLVNSEFTRFQPTISQMVDGAVAARVAIHPTPNISNVGGAVIVPK